MEIESGTEHSGLSGCGFVVGVGVVMCFAADNRGPPPRWATFQVTSATPQQVSQFLSPVTIIKTLLRLR
jgi:hypothetical protein